MTTKHTCNEGRGPVFGRKVAGCARCDELLAGAAPVVWRNRKAESEAATLRAIAAHFAPGSPHSRGCCGPVCTAFDW